MSNSWNQIVVASLAGQHPVEVAFIAKQILGGLDDLRIKTAICRDALRSETARCSWDRFFTKASDLATSPLKPVATPPPAAPVVTTPKPLGVPAASVRANNPSSLVSSEVTNAARQSSFAVQKQRLNSEAAGNASTANQLLGTTPENMQLGRQKAESEYQRLIQTADPEHNLEDPKTLATFGARANTFNPMHPSNDLMSSEDAAYAMANPWNLPRNLYAARRGLGVMASSVGRGVAGAYSFLPALGTDAIRSVTGQSNDWRNTQGAAYDVVSPLFKGLGVDPLGNNGVKSLHGEIMPQYSRALELAASQDGRPAWQRAGLNAASSLAGNSELVAGSVGAANMIQAPWRTSLRLAGSGLPAKATAIAAAGGQATGMLQKVKQTAMGTANVLGPTNAKWQAGFSVVPELQPNATGSGTRATDNAASVRAQNQNALGRHAAYQETGGAVGAPIPRGADGPGANLAMQPRYNRQGVKNDNAASAYAKMYDANTPKPPATPEEVVQRTQAATASIDSLPKMVQEGKITPDAAVPSFKSNLRDLAYSHAFQTGAAPGAHIATAAQLLDPNALKNNPGLASQLMQTPGAQELSKEVTTPGAPPFVEGVMAAIAKMPGWQRAAIGVGIPLAAIGIGQTLFGSGGMGSIIMSLLGVGMAGIGAFGGGGGGGDESAIPGMSTLNNYMRGTPTAGSPPAATPGSGAPAPATALAPERVGPVAPATTNLINTALSNNILDPQEQQDLLKDPWVPSALMQAPPERQQQFVRALRAGDPGLGGQLDKTHEAMQAKLPYRLYTVPAAYSAAAAKGISRPMLDTILAADR